LGNGYHSSLFGRFISDEEAREVSTDTLAYFATSSVTEKLVE